jgi:pimeloyl-ACP methyl ester carboxylesterase
MQKRIYVISGLGVDESVFTNLSFGQSEVVFLKWMKPSNNDTLNTYAKKLQSQIKDENPIIIGLSFGGMLAVEVAKLMTVHKLILLSSAKTKYEIPWYYRWPAKLYLHYVIPISLLKKANFISYYCFGIAGKENKILLRAILNNTDSGFLKWAINQIVKWDNQTLPSQCIHIHGTKDRILPIRFIENCITLENAGHFMVMQNAGEINVLIEKYV